ncbi:cytochrome b [Neisseriaceae bacterium TC5R-5]|nr:cytochrome b [Neisseriaceae bacterium TC5R-5]
MTKHLTGFSRSLRLLHWLMAVLILTMLFIGVHMVVSVSTTHTWMVALHRPLGVAILILVLIRFGIRLCQVTPSLPSEMPSWQQQIAKGSHIVLYLLMFCMPMIGWLMLSAGAYPIVLYGSWHLPSIAPHAPWLYALLRSAHTYVAYLFFLCILLHLAAALFHGLIRRDGVLSSMLTGKAMS